MMTVSNFLICLVIDFFRLGPDSGNLFYLVPKNVKQNGLFSLAVQPEQETESGEADGGNQSQVKKHLSSQLPHGESPTQIPVEAG